MASMERGPESISDLLRSLAWMPPVRQGAIWAAAVGSLLAGHSRVVALAEGRLVISVDSEAWLRELQAHEAELLERLALLGLEGIQSLELQVRSAPAPKEAPAPRPQLSPRQRRKLQSEVSEIQSAPVRQAMERFLAHLSEEELP